MYKVIKNFTDLQDEGRSYKVGDFYPRDGLEVSQARLKELTSSNNLRGKPLIKLIRKKKES